VKGIVLQGRSVSFRGGLRKRMKRRRKVRQTAEVKTLGQRLRGNEGRAFTSLLHVVRQASLPAAPRPESRRATPRSQESSHQKLWLKMGEKGACAVLYVILA